jgi:hypothetical protein
MRPSVVSDEGACAAVAAALAARVQGRLGFADAVMLEAHLATCEACHQTIGALACVRAAAGGGPDLWPRLAVCLAEERRPVRLRLPAFDWRAAIAAVLLVAVPWLAPASGRVAALVLLGAR